MTRRLALALLAALALAACGKKGPPVAPERRVPAAVADLAGVVRDGAMELAWTNPTRRVDGSRLRDLVGARVYRVDDGGAGEPKPALLAGERIAGYTEIAVIRLASPAPATVEGERVTLADRRALGLGRRYTYVVVAEDSTGRVSPPSHRLSLTFIAAPGPPRGLTAEAGEGEARLRWQPPAGLAGSSEPPGPLTYEILRSAALEMPPAPLTRVATTEHTDRGLENDRTYYYTVRAIRTEGGTTALGEPSARLAVTPRDTTPPSAPTNLVAIPSEGTVRLSWNPSPEPDVDRYIVYRREARGVFARIGSTRAPATAFVDRDVARGTYGYVVTAEDSAAQPNESARSNEVSVTVP